MTREQFRVFFDKHTCGCGEPETAKRALLRLLAAFEPDSTKYAYKKLDAWIPDDGVQYLLMYWIDHLGLIDHGSSVTSSWLTDNGKALLAALRVEEVEGFPDTVHCIHGVDIEEIDVTHKCSGDVPAPDPFAPSPG